MLCAFAFVSNPSIGYWGITGVLFVCQSRCYSVIEEILVLKLSSEWNYPLIRVGYIKVSLLLPFHFWHQLIFRWWQSSIVLIKDKRERERERERERDDGGILCLNRLLQIIYLNRASFSINKKRKSTNNKPSVLLHVVKMLISLDIPNGTKLLAI